MDLGFETANIDSVGNMVAVRGNGEPIILLCGHMDTVPGIVPVRLEGDYLYGRGASDAKAPLVSMLLAAADIPKQAGTIIFAAVVDEEGNATGIKNLVKEAFKFFGSKYLEEMELYKKHLHNKQNETQEDFLFLKFSNIGNSFFFFPLNSQIPEMFR